MPLTLSGAPSAVEITLKVGLIPTEDHGQLMIECVDAPTGTLLALLSTPHFPLSALRRELGRSLRDLAQLCEELVAGDAGTSSPQSC